MFSIQVLLYGDHHQLARRCLESIVASADWSLISDLRVGCNEICGETAAYLADVFRRVPVPSYAYAERTGRNVLKYPLMRRMFYDPRVPMRAQHVMWFDDDSYLWTKDPEWWERMHDIAATNHLVGKRYRLRGTNPPPRVVAAIEAQPWYRERKIPRGREYRFCQGGWWIARYSSLKRWDYPFPELKHNGGDTILGALAHQQEWSVFDTRDGVHINADADGNESKALRRGLTSKRLWEDYVPGQRPDLTHQEFDLTISTFEES